MWLKIKEYDNAKPILYGQNVVRTPFGVVMSDADVLANYQGKKLIPEGSFIVNVGNTVRFLPRSRAKLAVATNSANITLKSPSFAFKTGDVVTAVAGFAEITFGGTIASGDVFTLQINKVNYSFTSASNTGAAIAAGFVTDHASTLATAGIQIAQKGSTATLVIKANDAYPLNVYASSGTAIVSVSTTDPGFLGRSVIPLGTIQSIGDANAQGERVVTLAANAAYTLPINAPIGVVVDEYLGIYPHHLDFTEDPMTHIAPICEADGVYEQNLPYVDLQLKRVFNDLRINKRFYKNI